jgi:uncharacterized protein YggE
MLSRSRIRNFVLLLAVITLNNQAYAKDNNDNPRLISVNGEAKMNVVPDIVEVSLTVEITDKNLNVAQKKNDEIAAKVLQLAKSLSIEDKNVQTNYVNIQPMYDYSSISSKPAKPTLTGFQTQKGIQIKLTEINKLQELLEKSVEAGVTRVDGINFTSSKIDEIKNEVQIAAAKNALKKARDIATAVGAKVDKPYRISVGYSAPIPMRGNMPMMAKAVMSESADSTIAPGEVTITATVNADFEMD